MESLRQMQAATQEKIKLTWYFSDCQSNHQMGMQATYGSPSLTDTQLPLDFLSITQSIDRYNEEFAPTSNADSHDLVPVLPQRIVPVRSRDLQYQL